MGTIRIVSLNCQEKEGNFISQILLNIKDTWSRSRCVSQQEISFIASKGINTRLFVKVVTCGTREKNYHVCSKSAEFYTNKFY
jgi:hypothetical protein